MSSDAEHRAPEHPEAGPAARGASPVGRAWQGVRRRSLLPALVTALVVALVAGVVLLQRPRTYTSTRSVVVVPQKVSDLQQSAALFDTLSRGQVIATAAEMYGERRWNPSPETVAVTAGNVAPSAVVQVTAAGQDPDEVRRTLDAVVRAATPQIATVLAPYTVQTLDPAASEAQAGGMSLPVKALLALLAGLVAGILAAAATGALAGRRER